MKLGNAFNTARAILGSARPIVLYHKPTQSCDCRCRFCDFWQSHPVQDDTPSRETIYQLLDQARSAGMTIYTVWGGEPLLVEPLPEWLQYAHKLGFEVSLCTSGFHLLERASEIAPHTDRLLVSLEFADQRQDEIRRTPGLFQRVSQGIIEFRRLSKGQVVVWCNVNRLNKAHVDSIALFAQEHGVGVEFFPTSYFPTYNEQLILEADERREVFHEIRSLKRKGFPVRNTHYSLKLMGSGEPFSCNTARLSVQVFPDGTMYACEPRVNPDLRPYGAFPDIDLRTLHSTELYHRIRRELRNCNRCLLPCVANMSGPLPLQPIRRGLDILSTKLLTLLGKIS
jgi:MoaA/NifB/PqqE/SkfB family radical SAM enzyme